MQQKYKTHDISCKMLITTKTYMKGSAISHKYFTINERNKIEVLLKENYSVSKIDAIIGVHRTTVYRKIKSVIGFIMLIMCKKTITIK